MSLLVYICDGGGRGGNALIPTVYRVFVPTPTCTRLQTAESRGENNIVVAPATDG